MIVTNFILIPHFLSLTDRSTNRFVAHRSPLSPIIAEIILHDLKEQPIERSLQLPLY